MKTQERLTQAYKTAQVMDLAPDAKLIFFSDCHRGTGSHQDEFAKNQNVFLYALDWYYREGYTYVEVGDGDELWEHARFRDIKNAHYLVFESIRRYFRAGRLVLIYGNHNSYLKDPAYVRRHLYTYYNDYTCETRDFMPGIVPCEALVLRVPETGQEILTVHGHQGDLANDQFDYFTRFSLKYFWRHLHAFGIKNPASPVKNAHKRHKIEKNCDKWIEKNRRMLICGHTHRFKFPRSGELPYFNTGCCIYPTSITGLEITGRLVQLVRWRTLYNEDGLLQIRREVLRGPKPLDRFDIRE